MFESIVEKIKTFQKREDRDNFPKFSDNYTPFKIDAKNFKTLEALDYKKIAFIDGGNAEILNTGDLHLSIIRVCGVTFHGKKRTCMKKSEYFVLSCSFCKINEIKFRTSFSPIGKSHEINEIEFDSYDETLKNGINRADIGSAANASRRFAELKMAEHFANEVLCDIIVLDGNLQESYTHENEFMVSLQKSCMKNNITLCSLSKSSSLFTINGQTVESALDKLAPDSPWFYHPIAESNNERHNADIYFAKLHSLSRRAFRFEIYKEQKNLAEESLKVLAAYSSDPIFLGYPYGLIEVDRMARITNQERSSLKHRLSLYLGKDFHNAHDILDKISF